MEWVAKSARTKLSKQKSNKSLRANAKLSPRFFAKVRHNKNNNKLPREVGAVPGVGAVPRRTNVDKDSAHGGNFGNNRDSTSGKVVLVQEKFK